MLHFVKTNASNTGSDCLSSQIQFFEITHQAENINEGTVIGSGGREHALAWKISQSPRVKRLWVAPGNAGTALDAENVPIAADDIKGLVSFAKKEKVDLVVVGPEVPLTLGIVDAMASEKIRAFGPSRAAAQLEGARHSAN